MASYIITIPFLKKPFQDLKHPQRSYAMENAMNLQIALPNGQQHIGNLFAVLGGIHKPCGWTWQGGCQMSILLHKPYLVKLSTKGSKKCPKICPHGI